MRTDKKKEGWRGSENRVLERKRNTPDDQPFRRLQYWNDITTEKSWEILIKLRKTPLDFILIGGWAAWLWTKTHKSKDIDIVLKDFKAIDYLKQNYDLRKNEHLKKYEIKIEGIDIDIYTPYFSKLIIPPEDLTNYSTILENINVITPEALLILKQKAELDRRGSAKGEKDAIDIMTILLNTDISFEKYKQILKRYNHNNLLAELRNLIKTFDIKNITYLNLNPRTFKLRKRELLERLKEHP